MMVDMPTRDSQRTYGPRTAWLCSHCGTALRRPGSVCGCGGAARPEGLIDPVEAEERSAGRLLGRIARLFGG